VVKAWAEFVDHRKEMRHALTPTSWRKTVLKMVSRDPAEIVKAIDTAIECGWRGIFFRDAPRQPAGGRVPAPPAPPADPDVRKVCALLSDTVGSASEAEAFALVSSWRAFHAALPGDPRRPGRGAARRLPFSELVDRFVAFARAKDASGFTLSAASQLRVGSIRWVEFIRDCERFTGYSFKTGEYQG
jgi:hypothetical protein